MKAEGKAVSLAVGFGYQQRLIAVLVAMVLFIGMTVYTFVVVAGRQKDDNFLLQHANELRVVSQEVAKNAVEAANGKADAFQKLKESRDKFDKSLGLLKDARDVATGQKAAGQVPSLPEETHASLEQVDVSWKAVRPQVDVLLNNWQTTLGLYELSDTFGKRIPALQALADEATSMLIERGASSRQVYIATRQLLLAETLTRNINRVLKGGEGAVTAADSFGRNTGLFGRVLTGMLEGDSVLGIPRVNSPDVRAKLELVQAEFSKIQEQVGRILAASPELFQVRESADSIFRRSEELASQTSSLERNLVELAKGQFLTPTTGYAFLALSVLTLLLLGYMIQSRTKQEQVVTEQQRKAADDANRRNQAAILRLLDEMTSLADGDLTVKATVTEDITGAIADSINYAIDAMRNMVTTINQTSEQISAAAQQTRSTAMHLAEASDHQAQQINSASKAINDMAMSIDKVSRSATDSANVAQKAVQIASKGADTVRRTIAGMDKIRETIQETSKRIKRLGESSQEIGAIVELINDIADQTNILALNAAIQAAMAGEAGRGFAVVADEVQRLAERSTDATKQIEALIKTIQADTNEAVSSMEQSTAGVVSGAKLAEDAGEALTEIETVSGHLAKLIRGISEAASQQAAAAANVSDTMNVIQDITMQTSAGTNETAVSIGNLTELATELRRSVAGFKLPAELQGRGTADHTAEFNSVEEQVA